MVADIAVKASQRPVLTSRKRKIEDQEEFVSDRPLSSSPLAMNRRRACGLWEGGYRE
jgi:hypothetical protein